MLAVSPVTVFAVTDCVPIGSTLGLSCYVYFIRILKNGPERKGSYVRCFSDATSKPYFIMQGKMFLP